MTFGELAKRLEAEHGRLRVWIDGDGCFRVQLYSVRGTSCGVARELERAVFAAFEGISIGGSVVCR